MLAKLRSHIKQNFHGLISDTVATPLAARSLLLQGSIASMRVRDRSIVERLCDIEFSVFSQWGEDGIIDWLIERNGHMPETFIEFGVETYREASTRFLLAHRNWRGLIIDGSPENIAVARTDHISWQHDLTSVAHFITIENINTIISNSGFTGEIGILSVDIDGNDYWVWDAIDCVSPHFVIVEYNAQFGDMLPLTIPYAAEFFRTTGHYSNLYWGASIDAFARLANKKGYTLLGTNRVGTNAFFVRNDRLGRFEHCIADRRPFPSRLREGLNADGSLSFARGIARMKIIADMPVVDLQSGATVALKSLDGLFSDRWLAMMDGDSG